MAIAYVDGNVGSTAAGTNNISTGNIAVAGSNLLLLGHACSGDYTGLAPSSVKWGGSSGTALSKVADQSISTFFNATLWQLIAPTVQTSTAYSLWPSNLGELGLIGVAYSGVDQTTPTGTVAVATGTGSNAPSVNVSSVAGDIVVGFCYVGTGGGGITSLTSGQTERKKIVTLGGAGYEAMSASETTASGTTTTMSWTASKNVSWVAIGVALKAAAAGTTINAGTGALAVTCQSPSVSKTGAQSVAASAGVLAVAGQSPSVQNSANVYVTTGAGSLSVAGVVPTLTLQKAAPQTGQLTVVGVAPTVAIGAISVSAGTGALSLAGQAPSFSRTDSHNIATVTGALAIAGVAPVVAAAGAVAANIDTGLLSLAGQSPSVSRTDSHAIAASTGALSLAGQVPTISADGSVGVAAGTGALAVAGVALTVSRTDSQIVNTGSGAIVVSGLAPSVSQAGGWSVSPGTGAVQFAGYAPSLSGAHVAGLGGGGGWLFTDWQRVKWKKKRKAPEKRAARAMVAELEKERNREPQDPIHARLIAERITQLEAQINERFAEVAERIEEHKALEAKKRRQERNRKAIETFLSMV